MFLWEQQRLAGRLPRGGTGDSVLLPLAQGSHRPLSRAQSSPAAPASLPTPEPASQARVLPSSETPARSLPFTTGKAKIRVGQEKGQGAHRGSGISPYLVLLSLGTLFEATEHLLGLVTASRCPMKEVEWVMILTVQMRTPGLGTKVTNLWSKSKLRVKPG